MNILLHLGTVILLLLSACGSNQPAANNPNTNQKTNAVSDKLTNSDRASQAKDDFIAALQGRWQRTTYPYGTVEFKGDRVKFVEGEGVAEPPQFNRFRLSNSCFYLSDKEQTATYLDYESLEKHRMCVSVKISGDSLLIGFTPSTETIVYNRIQDTDSSSEASKSQNYSISKSIWGKWAIGEENCGVRNHQQITINANSIDFFENQAELLQITEYEPTRVAGNFDYKLSDGEVQSYQMTLDVKENGKVLILREYGEDARPAPIGYDRCE